MKVRWGVLSTAKIGIEHVIPAMQAGAYCDVVAIASRSLARAEETARWLGLSRAYGSYEELLAAPDIDAVYIPLPNHLHVPWAVESLDAGKHVLCEKPIALDAEEARELLEAAREHPELKAMEAFMYRFHPQWLRARHIVQSGGIGELRTIQTFFSFYNVDPGNIRNQRDSGGGALMDIGCYCISLSRWLFEDEPRRVLGLMEVDPEFAVDRKTCGVLEFERGTATFTCGTQLAPYQRVNIVGTTGRVEIEIPFNAPADKACRLWHHTQAGTEEIRVEPVNQYSLQCDLFSRAVLDGTEVPTPLQDAVANMAVIDAVVRSAEEQAWIDLG